MIKEALYTPPGAPQPEPVATLVYEGYEFEISYTLMHWITGWLAHGMFGAHSVPVAAKENTRHQLFVASSIKQQGSSPSGAILCTRGFRGSVHWAWI
jgi:hypothetical protein